MLVMNAPIVLPEEVMRRSLEVHSSGGFVETHTSAVNGALGCLDPSASISLASSCNYRTRVH